MARIAVFLLGLLILAHYVVLGAGTLGGTWRNACLEFYAGLGLDFDWQLRMTHGMPGVVAAALLMFWGLWPKIRPYFVR